MNNSNSAPPSRESVSKAWILDVRFKIDYKTGVEGCPENPSQFRFFAKLGE